MESKRWCQAGGFTLIEVLVSISILVIVVVSTVGVLLAGQGSVASITGWADQNQQLRLAMKQITDDLSTARWTGDPDGADQVTVTVWQPVVDRGNYADWSVPAADWPGDLVEWSDLSIKYVIENDSLIREVFDGFGKYSRRVVLSDLQAGSYISVSSATHLVKVHLRKQATGVTRIVEAHSEFYLR